jgi:hypothetical protein
MVPVKQSMSVDIALVSRLDQNAISLIIEMRTGAGDNMIFKTNSLTITREI